MKIKSVCAALLCVLSLLLTSCQKSSIRNVVMKPDASSSQADQNAQDGTLKEIRSFPVTATVNGETVNMQIHGWMDATHLWCETYGNGITGYSTVDDSFGFVKKLSGTDFQLLLGISPDGRYAVGFEKDTQKMGSALILYDSKTEQTTRILQMGTTMSLQTQSACFSQDGRYMSFLVALPEAVNDAGAFMRLQIIVYDLEDHLMQTYVADMMRSVYPNALEITEAKSLHDLSGWMITSNEKGLVNAIYMHLIEGKAIPQAMVPTENRRIYDLQMSKLVASGRGLAMGKSLSINQSSHWYDNAAIIQTSNGRMLAVDLRNGNGRVLAENLRSMIVSSNGKRAAFYSVSNAGAEIYTARIELDSSGMPTLENMRLVYTGKSIALLFWNQDASKFVLYESDEKNKASYYRVLTLNTATQ